MRWLSESLATRSLIYLATLCFGLPGACRTTVDALGSNASTSAQGGSVEVGGSLSSGGTDTYSTGGAAASGSSAGAPIGGEGGAAPVGGSGGSADTGGSSGSGAVAGMAGGSGGSGIVALRPVTGPATYPNYFKDVLKKTDLEIQTKINSVYQQLFHGTASQVIYYTSDDGLGWIRDTLHNDIRTEGIGYGMIITVELDKQQEFDSLWSYAKTTMRVASGANKGYFRSSCDISVDLTGPCYDPFGLEQFVTALVFAHHRWGSNGDIDYQTDAIGLFELMRNKEADNGGRVEGVTDTFDDETKLVFDVPNISAGQVTRPSIEMPAYYEVWAQTTGDPYWHAAAVSARAFLKSAAHPTTGLLPIRADFDGTPVAGSDTFSPEGYRAQLNMALDTIWYRADPWQADEANRLLNFFYSQDLEKYCKVYTLDGACKDPLHELSLVAVNGVSAAIATTNRYRASFIQAAWDIELPTNTGRYYTGILHLLSLLLLSGQYQIR